MSLWTPALGFCYDAHILSNTPRSLLYSSIYPGKGIHCMFPRVFGEVFCYAECHVFATRPEPAAARAQARLATDATVVRGTNLIGLSTVGSAPTALPAKVRALGLSAYSCQ